MVYSLLKAFFELYWDPDYSSNILFQLVLGSMNARAVVTVEMQQGRLRPRKPNFCIDQVVPLRPRFCPIGCPATLVRDFKRSKNYTIGPEYDVFAFHETAVERHRKKTVVPFFLAQCRTRGVTAGKFYNRLVDTAQRWAQASLVYLSALPSQIPHLKIVVQLQNT